MEPGLCFVSTRSEPGATWDGARSTCRATATGRLAPMRRQFDVGMDARGFRPVTLATLLTPRRAFEASTRAQIAREGGEGRVGHMMLDAFGILFRRLLRHADRDQ